MKTVQLGQTGAQVSALCLGVMYYGTSVSEADAYHLLDSYVDAGGAFIDTANVYARWVEGFSGGESETLLGRWMRERQNRDQLFIATKMGAPYRDVPRSLKSQYIEQECEKSLKRLGIETIDLYYAHTDDRDTPQEETMAAFDRLVTAGKVCHLGASNFPAWRLESAYRLCEANGWARHCCVQQRHSYLVPRARVKPAVHTFANEDLLDYVQFRGLSLVAYSPLAKGAYSRPDREFPNVYTGPDNRARLAMLRTVSEEVGGTANQVVLAWLMHSSPAVIPLFSASTRAQMNENLGALGIELSAEQMQRLNQAGLD
jgi:aryl-alcohol dehydrogenase-like predicted oxidoreductase